MCVCVFLASRYRWVTVMHEIPISSAHLLTSLPYPRTRLYYSSGPPGGLAREGSNEPVVSWLWDSMAAAGGQLHNLGSFPVTTSQELVKEGRHMSALHLQLGTVKYGVDGISSVRRSMTAAAHLA